MVSIVEYKNAPLAGNSWHIPAFSTKWQVLAGERLLPSV